jgi:hypothetical protein
MAGETDDPEVLLAEARAAAMEYDPEDGLSINSPHWRLCSAFERLDEVLSGGAPLPSPWQVTRADGR